MAKKQKEEQELNMQEKIDVFFSEIYKHNDYQSNYYKNISNDSCLNYILASATVGGSRGGDCWGGRTSDYSNDSDEIISDILSVYKYSPMAQFISKESAVFDEIAKEAHSNCEVGDYYDNYDYYGNCSENRCYSVKIERFAEILLKNNILSEEDITYFNSKFLETLTNKEKELTIKSKQKEYKTICDKIDKFNISKEEESENIKKEIIRMTESLKHLENKQHNFEKNKHKELNRLLFDKNEIENFFGDYLEPKSENKKKNKP